MPTTPLVSLTRLEVAARKAPGSLTDNPYAAFCAQEASEVVCDRAKHPQWEDDSFDGVVPREAKRIALAIAVRALNNPEMEVSYNTGPIGARYREEYAYGFEPTPYEDEQLEDMRPTGTSGGLWVQPTGGGLEELPGQVWKKDNWHDDMDSQLINYQDEGDVGTGYDEAS